MENSIINLIFLHFSKFMDEKWKQNSCLNYTTVQISSISYQKAI
jgi:membrane protease subunit (stomatin/prohibitin family)